jgi:hypothetical protein
MVILLTGFAASAVAEWLLLSIAEFRSGLPIVLIAALHMTFVMGANAAGMHVAANVLRRDIDSLAGHSKATAAWIAPLVVYVVAKSVWAVPFAAFVTFLAVALIRSLRVGSQKSHIESGRVTCTQMFQLLPGRHTPRLLWFFACGLSVETAAIASAGRAVWPAILLASIAAAITSGHIDHTRRAYRENPLQQNTSALLTLALALMLTVGGLRDSGTNPGGSIADARGSAYRGIFLWPEDGQQAVQLVAPPRSLPSTQQYEPRIPIRIPFNGVYWLFRHPDMRPPDDAVTAHGNPEQLRFRSTDATTLIMEAHQHFDSPLDLSCCNRIEVEIGVADDDTTDVFLEVVLGSSMPGYETPLSLGVVPVRSRLHEQLLTFAVPVFSSLINFDDITIRYHFGSQGDTKSAKIGIRYLVLMPR